MKSKTHLIPNEYIYCYSSFLYLTGKIDVHETTMESMETLSDVYDNGEVEKAELELYGLKNDYEDEQHDDSEEERAAVEEAMFMRIHYAAAVDETDNKKDALESTVDSKDDVSENESPDNKTISSPLLDNQYDNINVEKIQRIDEKNAINTKLSAPGETFKPQLLIEEQPPGVVQSPGVANKDEECIDKTGVSLDNSVILLDSISDDDSHSKYAVMKSSNKADKSNVAKNIPGNVQPMPKKDDTTICISSSESSSESDNEICVISTNSSQKDSRQSSSTTAKPLPVPGGLKISRNSVLDLKAKLAKSVLGEQGKHKQRTWRATNTSSSTSSRGVLQTIEITSETIAKSLKDSENKLMKDATGGRTDVAGSSKDDGNRSDSDCMLIESMSDDDDMDFNFVIPLGMSQSKQEPSVDKEMQKVK